MMPKIHPTVIRFGSVCVLLSTLLLTGCQRGDPLDQKVEASTPGEFVNWQARAEQHLSTQQAEGLTAAVGELKLKEMAHGAKGQDAVDTAFAKSVDGHTIRDVVQEGLSWKLARLQEQRAYIDSFLKQNSELQTKPGDSASADYLAHRRDMQTAQRNQLDQQIDALKKQMTDLGLQVKAADLGPHAGPQEPDAGVPGTGAPAAETPGAATPSTH